MRGIALRVALLLVCVVAIGCGGSNPSSPSAPSTPSGGGGGGTPPPGGGGGGGPTGQTAVASDDVFDDNNWDAELQVSGAGGTGSASHLRYMGRADGDYRHVSITVNSTENSASAAQVVVFSIKRGTAYFPSSDGRIFTIDYSEDSIRLTGGGNGQFSAPAIKQNGKLYTLVPGAGAFATPEAAWTRRTLTGLRQTDFRTLASATDNPDFSSTGARMELGFMRLHSLPAGRPRETVTGGIDNWRITLNR